MFPLIVLLLALRIGEEQALDERCVATGRSAVHATNDNGRNVSRAVSAANSTAAWFRPCGQLEY
jgi:hypothetical protein